MPCSRPHFRFRRGTATVGVSLIAASCTAISPHVRGPVPYHAPSIVVAYPERGASLPADKPFVVLRFAPGEADDPIDVASFRATVDDADRTTLFRVSEAQAWGRLGDTLASGGAGGVTPGQHVVSARVCSTRGACGTLTVAIDVRAWDHAFGPANDALGMHAGARRE